MGSSKIYQSTIWLLSLMILCPAFSWGATVGLVVEKPSKQATYFHQQLSQLHSSDTIQLINKDQLPSAKNIDKWIVIGPQVLDYFLSLSTYKQPVLSLFTNFTTAEQLRKKYPKQIFSTLTNTPTLDRQLALIKVLHPQAKRIAVYYSAQKSALVKGLKPLVESLGLELISSELTDPLNWKRSALQALKNSDLVLAVDDAAIYNATNIRSILMRLYRAGRPLFGPDKGYVRAGAVASVYSGMKETIKACVDLLKAKEPWPTYIHNPYFNVAINKQVARSLNISVEDPKVVTEKMRGLLP